MDFLGSWLSSLGPTCKTFESNFKRVLLDFLVVYSVDLEKTKPTLLDREYCNLSSRQRQNIISTIYVLYTYSLNLFVG